MKATLFLMFTLLAVFILGGITGHAQVPGTISYQGRLTGTGGTPLDTTVNMVFTIYTASSGGTVLWTETRTGVVVTDGLFSVALGAVNPISLAVFGGADRWLGIKVGADAEMAPRVLLTAAPYAQVASWAKTSDTADYALAGSGGDGHSLDAADGSPVDAVSVDNDGHTLMTGNLTIQRPEDSNFVAFADRFAMTAHSTGTDYLGLKYIFGGANAMVMALTQDGRVGIGTTAPTQALDVVGGLSLQHAEDSSFVKFYQGGGDRFALTTHSTGTDYLGFKHVFGGADKMVMALTEDGRLGIGTSAPLFPLHVEGTTLINTPAGENVQLYFSENLGRKWGIMYRATEGCDLRIYDDMANRNVMTFDSGTGYVGVGTTAPLATLDVNGGARVAASLLVGDTVTCDVVKITGGADLAEPFDLHNAEAIQPGMLLVIDPLNPGKLTVAQGPYDRCVAGVVSGAGGIEPGLVMGQAETIASGKYPVAMTGRVYCLAEADGGPIRPGDLLTTSAVPGHAMRVTDFGRAQGAVIGKAMTSLESGRGLVLVLVSLQ